MLEHSLKLGGGSQHFRRVKLLIGGVFGNIVILDGSGVERSQLTEDFLVSSLP